MESFFLLGLLLIVIFCIVFVLNRKTKEHFHTKYNCDNEQDEVITIPDFEIYSHHQSFSDIEFTNKFIVCTVEAKDEDRYWDLRSISDNSIEKKYKFLPEVDTILSNTAILGKYKKGTKTLIKKCSLLKMKDLYIDNIYLKYDEILKESEKTALPYLTKFQEYLLRNDFSLPFDEGFTDEGSTSDPYSVNVKWNGSKYNPPLSLESNIFESKIIPKFLIVKKNEDEFNKWKLEINKEEILPQNDYGMFIDSTHRHSNNNYFYYNILPYIDFTPEPNPPPESPYEGNEPNPPPESPNEEGNEPNPPPGPTYSNLGQSQSPYNSHQSHHSHNSRNSHLEGNEAAVNNSRQRALETQQKNHLSEHDRFNKQFETTKSIETTKGVINQKITQFQPQGTSSINAPVNLMYF